MKDFKTYCNETGEADQNYNHAMWDNIVKQLADAGFKGASHREFDKYQGVILTIPGCGKFGVDNMYSTGEKVKSGTSDFTYKEGTRVDHWLLTSAISDGGTIEITVTEDGDVDATELIEYCISMTTNESILYERKFSDAKRQELAKSGQALSDGSYPIVTVADLKNAIKASGRAKDFDKVKRHIKKRAKALKQEDLIPEDWK
jgi:hypothetical protein